MARCGEIPTPPSVSLHVQQNGEEHLPILNYVPKPLTSFLLLSVQKARCVAGSWARAWEQGYLSSQYQ